MNDEKLIGYLKSNAPEPPAAPRDELSRIHERMAPKVIPWPKLWVPALAVGAILAVVILMRPFDPTPNPVEVAKVEGFFEDTYTAVYNGDDYSDESGDWIELADFVVK